LLSPALKMGMTFAIFSLYGTLPTKREQLFFVQRVQIVNFVGQSRLSHRSISD